MSETRIERQRGDSAFDAIDALDGVGDVDGTVMIAKTVEEEDYPTSANSTFAMHPLGVDGDEAEGDAASFTEDSSRTFFASNVGSAAPPQGTKVLVFECGGRWIFRYDG